MCTNTKLYKALPHLVSVTVINSLMSATDPPSLSRRGRGRGRGWGRLTVATLLHWMTGPGPGSQMVTLSVSMFSVVSSFLLLTRAGHAMLT